MNELRLLSEKVKERNIEKMGATALQVEAYAYQLKCMQILLSLILLLALSSSVSSQTIVKTLPGFSGQLPFVLETGYIGVGELDEVQLFYYFVVSEEQPADAPLVLWLGGGLGCSALSAFFYEIGPLAFNSEKSRGGHKPVLELNHYSWTKVANIIFLDSPVGTGFSYSITSDGYNTSDTKSVDLAYEFLRKWLLTHPDFHTNPVYIAGDSYSGITVPALVKKISDGNKARSTAGINLRGYVLGNPFTDVKYDVNSRVQFAHRVALLDDEIYDAAKVECNGDYVNPNSSNTECMEYLEIIDLCLKNLYDPMILEPTCSMFSPQPKILKWDSSPLGVTPRETLLSDANPIDQEWCRNYNYLFVYIWANDKAVQEALNVRNGTITEWERCNETRRSNYTFDILSSLDYHRNFTSKDLRALIYSGDHDLIIPYLGTELWIQSLNLSVSTDDEWRPWFVDGQIGGYTEIYREKKYSITFVTVKGAGHTAPEYKPKESFAMILRWLAYYFL